MAEYWQLRRQDAVKCMIQAKEAVQMQDHVELDELGRRVLHALQIDPRASWARIGAVLGVDPVTAARRWDGLRADGVAWTRAHWSAASRQQEMAVVEIDSAGDPLLVADQLGDDSSCITIDITSGGRDLLLTVVAPDLHTLTDYLLERIARLEHIRGVRTHLVSQVVAEASSWRLGVLTKAEQASLQPTTHVAASVSRTFTAHESAVLEVLADDARANSTAIAERTGLSPRRVRDLLRDLLQTGRVTLRTEMQAAASGRPIYAWYFLRAPASAAAALGPRIASLPDIRGIFRASGPSNLIMAVWLRDLADVSRLEAALESQLEGVEVVDRSVVLRCVKRIGVQLDRKGRRRDVQTPRKQAGSGAAGQPARGEK